MQVLRLTQNCQNRPQSHFLKICDFFAHELLVKPVIKDTNKCYKNQAHFHLQFHLACTTGPSTLPILGV